MGGLTCYAHGDPLLRKTMPITFGDAVVHYLPAPLPEEPSPGDSLLVLWDTSDETRIYGKAVRAWVPAVLLAVPTMDEGELSSIASESSTLFYPANELRALFGPHSGMVVHQNIGKLPWKWHAPSDSWEYACHREMARQGKMC